MFNLEKDVDKVWQTHDFGQGDESYLLSEYTQDMVAKLRKQYSTPNTKQDDVKHQANLREIRKKNTGKKLKDAIRAAEVKHEQPNVTPESLAAWQEEALILVLHDWENAIVDDRGKKIECTEAAKITLAKKSTLRREWLLIRAQIPYTFYPDHEDILGNSGRPSSSEKNGKAAKGSSLIAESV